MQTCRWRERRFEPSVPLKQMVRPIEEHKPERAFRSLNLRINLGHLSACLRRADRMPDFLGCRRHVDMGDAEGAERVDDGVHDRGERADIAGLAGALDPSGLVLVGTGYSSISNEQTSSARGIP